MSSDSEAERSERLSASQQHIANARKIVKRSRRLREASERLLVGKKPRRTP